jgi:uroporphyrinogen-III synthase
MDEKFFVCIGKKTAQKLKEFGFKASYVCKRNYSKFMSDEIKKSGVLKDKKSLLVQGSLSDNSLLDSLISFSNTQKAIFYNTELLKNKYDDLEKICQKEEPYVIFTSPSSFDSFINHYDPKKVNIVSIGNTTSSHINGKGFDTVLTSKMQSFEGISESLMAFLKEKSEYELS